MRHWILCQEGFILHSSLLLLIEGREHQHPSRRLCAAAAELSIPSLYPKEAPRLAHPKTQHQPLTMPLSVSKPAYRQGFTSSQRASKASSLSHNQPQQCHS